MRRTWERGTKEKLTRRSQENDLVSNYPYLAALLRLVRFPTVRTRKALGMLGLNEATNQGARNPLPRATSKKLRKFQARRLYISKRKVRVGNKNSMSEPIKFVAVQLFGCLPGRFPDNTFESAGSRGSFQRCLNNRVSSPISRMPLQYR
jgi:hypothetical protein